MAKAKNTDIKSMIRSIVREEVHKILKETYLPNLGETIFEAIEDTIEAKLNEQKVYKQPAPQPTEGRPFDRESLKEMVFGGQAPTFEMENASSFVQSHQPTIQRAPANSVMERAKRPEDLEMIVGEGGSVVDMFADKDFSAILNKSFQMRGMQ